MERFSPLEKFPFFPIVPMATMVLRIIYSLYGDDSFICIFFLLFFSETKT